MKRSLIFGLIVLLIFAPALGAEAYEKHTFMGIPWEISLEELAEAVYEASGIRVEVVSRKMEFMENGMITEVAVSTNDQRITLLGMPVGLEIEHMIDRDELDSIRLFIEEEYTVPKETEGRKIPALVYFGRLAAALEARYGQPTICYVMPYGDENAEIYKISGSITDDVLYSFQEFGWKAGEAELCAMFDNVELSFVSDFEASESSAMDVECRLTYLGDAEWVEEIHEMLEDAPEFPAGKSPVDFSRVSGVEISGF